MVAGSPHAADGDAMTRLDRPELVEHVATYAAERGDTELEQLCDDVLAGLTEESLLIAVVSGDPDLQEAVERGRNVGWRSRRGGVNKDTAADKTAIAWCEHTHNLGRMAQRRVQDAFERATVAITGRSYAEVAADIAPRPERPSAMGSRFAKIAPPPGIDLLREQVYRIRYNRERRMAVEVDGVSWPVDLGEAG